MRGCNELIQALQSAAVLRIDTESASKVATGFPFTREAMRYEKMRPADSIRSGNGILGRLQERAQRHFCRPGLLETRRFGHFRNEFQTPAAYEKLQVCQSSLSQPRGSPRFFTAVS
jgi:hypothetical protein